jgi:hypothetical protein
VHKIVVNECIDRLDAHLCRNIAGLQGAENLVDQDTVAIAIFARCS